ncbi:DNA repair protein RecO [Roseospira visakhapatnamensis]|uniref:DNA repair protein RecO n=1 Tax=Roseospira visakhapatnamensis TaxID=390880 RepID=A0A7W6RAH1_9PROT|nr:DNA repair protein RecO [Roseospira visakhapatnamensis]MBB4264923.1 DNA repair protein RecO (recombination protein O) [Roseospira visakhapatnamensis]
MAIDWRDEGVVLSARPHGESSLLVSVLTREHGRHMGLVRGGAGKAARGLYQPGNRLSVTWKARLAEHLGNLTAEMADAVAARLLAAPERLSVLAAACAVADGALPEREPMAAVFDDVLALLALLMDDARAAEAGAALVVWERALLADLGFGLDLSRCAATGRHDTLIYVSPKSGRAVSASAGEPYGDRLLPLPPFLLGEHVDLAAVPPAQVADGLRLTGFFLDRHVFAPRNLGLPAARVRLARRVARGRVSA